jgi:hypothetical protein
MHDKARRSKSGRGGNARVYNIYTKKAKLDLKADQFAKIKAEYETQDPERSNLRYGYINQANVGLLRARSDGVGGPPMVGESAAPLRRHTNPVEATPRPRPQVVARRWGRLPPCGFRILAREGTELPLCGLTSRSGQMAKHRTGTAA